MANGAIMVAFFVVMVLTYVGIAYERLHKTIAALIGAGVAILLGVFSGIFPYDAIYTFLQEDLSVLGVIIGTGILVAVTARSGFFQFIGIRVVKATAGNRRRLFLYLNLLTFGLVSFLTIVPSILIVVALTLVACRALEYDPKPYLISEAVVANAGALTTYASSIPNLIVGTAAQIPYLTFLVVSAPMALMAFLLAHYTLGFLLRGHLRGEREEEPTGTAERIAQFDEWSVVRNRTFFRRSGVVLLGTVAGFVIAPQLGIGLEFVALSGATAALFISGVDTEEAIREINWPIVIFFVALFALVAAVQASGLLATAADALLSVTGADLNLTQTILLWFSAGASGVVDNIPVSATLVPIVRAMGAAGVDTSPLWWSIIFGANLGGSITPIGSISCVIALHSLETEAHSRVGWWAFIKVGGLVTVLQLSAATAYLLTLTRFNLIPSI